VYYAKAVEVLDTLHDLEDDCLCMLLRQDVVSLRNVIKQVFTCHVLQHDKVVLTALKQVDQFNDARVLAHLEHFDLTPLLQNLDRLHVRFDDRLYCDLLL